MSDVITRNTPTHYELLRIALQLDEDDNIVALADMKILNVDGLIIDNDHPTTTLTAGEETVFKTWVLGKLADYEAATGLERYVPPE